MPPISDLEDRVLSLSARFLDVQITSEADTTFNPSLDDIAAFRLLVHAEIEDWLERCASTDLNDLAQRCASPTPLRTSSRLFLLASLFEVQLPLSLPFSAIDFQKSATEILNKARQFVRDNNGIKAGSFCKIAVICGACIDEIDDNLIQALNSYGTARGMVAHKSSQRVTSLLAPSAEKNEAMNLIRMLKTFFGTLHPI